MKNPLRQAKPTKEEQQTLDEKALLVKAQSIWKYLSEARRRAELDWFINQQAHDNNQYLYYNTATRTLQPVATVNKHDKVRINRVAQQVRSVVSFINQRKPQVTTIPGSQADDAYIRARKSKHLCDYWYDALQMNKKNKLISKDGCINGLGWAKIMWNKDALAPTVPFTMETGEERTTQYGEVMFERCDTFEVYPDPQATCKEDLRYIAHAIPRTIGELKSNPEYKNTENIQPDKKLAASNLKQTQMRQSIGGAGATASSSGVSDLDTVVAIEVFWHEWSDATKKWKIRQVTMTEGGVGLKYGYWEVGELPFEPFMADISGSLLQSKGIVHNIREPNRAVNDLVSQILKNARVMGNINWKMPRGANVGVITDESGQYIEYDYNPAGGPEQVSAAGIPAHVPNLVAYLDSAIMDLGGAHDASVGKNVFSGASGELVKSLQGGDAASLAMLRDNYDDFLVRSFKLMLKTAKHFGTAKRTLPASDRDELGQYRWVELEPKEISTEDSVQVRSGSNLPYTADQRQEFFMELWKEKVITDRNELFKLMDLPDVANTLGDDELDIERELDNIRNCMADKQIPSPQVSENHQVHIATLDKFVRGPKFLTLPPQQQAAIMDHRTKHADMASQQVKSAALNQFEPIRRTEQVNLQVRDMSGATPQERAQVFSQFNMQSDAADIQRRGGLVVQNPEDAKNQAHAEDIQMMDGAPTLISLGDNHLVHLQEHNSLKEDPRFAVLPPSAQKALDNHIQQHEQAMQNLMPAPGLVPGDTTPPAPH